MAQLGKPDAGFTQSPQGMFGEDVCAMRQDHARRVAQQNWQSLGLLLFRQVDDDFHSKPVAFGKTFAMK
jgi:hypothetical protein